MSEYGQLELMSMHLDALYILNEANGRILAVNQWDGGSVPRFHLGRTRQGVAYRFRDDIPAVLENRLKYWCDDEPLQTDICGYPVHLDKYIELLEDQQPVNSIWQGPVYRFRLRPEMTSIETTLLNKDNRHLLETCLSDWLPDVGHRWPFIASIADNHAVSVCASVRVTERAHEAGLETFESYRKRGFAVAAVSAWANAVFDQGAIPFYSTSWDNVRSQNVALSLELDFVGTDFHVG